MRYFVLGLLLSSGCASLEAYRAKQFAEHGCCIPVCDKVLGELSTVRRDGTSCVCQAEVMGTVRTAVVSNACAQ